MRTCRPPGDGAPCPWTQIKCCNHGGTSVAEALWASAPSTTSTELAPTFSFSRVHAGAPRLSCSHASTQQHPDALLHPTLPNPYSRPLSPLLASQLTPTHSPCVCPTLPPPDSDPQEALAARAARLLGPSGPRADWGDALTVAMDLLARALNERFAGAKKPPPARILLVSNLLARVRNDVGWCGVDVVLRSGVVGRGIRGLGTTWGGIRVTRGELWEVSGVYSWVRMPLRCTLADLWLAVRPASAPGPPLNTPRATP